MLLVHGPGLRRSGACRCARFGCRSQAPAGADMMLAGRRHFAIENPIATKNRHFSGVEVEIGTRTRLLFIGRPPAFHREPRGWEEAPVLALPLQGSREEGREARSSGPAIEAGPLFFLNESHPFDPICRSGSSDPARQTAGRSVRGQTVVHRAPPRYAAFLRAHVLIAARR